MRDGGVRRAAAKTIRRRLTRGMLFFPSKADINRTLVHWLAEQRDLKDQNCRQRITVPERRECQARHNVLREFCASEG
jgi:hypothetical protein